MSRIICENAKVWLSNMSLHCDSDCPICRGIGFTVEDVVDVSKVRELFETEFDKSRFGGYDLRARFLNALDKKVTKSYD